MATDTQPTGTYIGRLMIDENGNLVADQSKKLGTRTLLVFDENGNKVFDESGDQASITIPVSDYGPEHGFPVALTEAGTYDFLKPGDLSHNQQYHKQFVTPLVPTQDKDPESPGYAGTKESPNPGFEHHWETLPDDAHYDSDADDNLFTKIVNGPDIQQRLATGHTEAYAGLHEDNDA